MITQQADTHVDLGNVDELSERLADVFRTADVGDVFTHDVFLDGHPPFWRFQLQGVDAFASWLRGYAPEGLTVNVVRTIPTMAGFVTEHETSKVRDRQDLTGRKILLCAVREGRIAELVVYCSGDWDEQLRLRHAAEAPMIRP